MHSIFLKLAPGASALSAASAAITAPVCTMGPPAKRLSQAVMQATNTKMGYRDIMAFKVSRSYYEIYAHTQYCKRTEVYSNPVTAVVVHNKIN